MKYVAIPLPEPLLAHMQAQVRSGVFSDEGDYLRSLIATDCARTEALAAAIDEGLRSGTSDRTVEEIFEDVKRRRIEAGPQ